MDRQLFKILFKNKDFMCKFKADKMAEKCFSDNNTLATSLIIAIEEMAELQQMLAKCLRYLPESALRSSINTDIDYLANRESIMHNHITDIQYGLYEEIADVYIVLAAVARKLDISDDELKHAKHIKYIRYAHLNTLAVEQWYYNRLHKYELTEEEKMYFKTQLSKYRMAGTV